MSDWQHFEWDYLTSHLLEMAGWRLLPHIIFVVLVSRYFQCKAVLFAGLIGTILGPLFVAPTHVDLVVDGAKATGMQWQNYWRVWRLPRMRKRMGLEAEPESVYVAVFNQICFDNVSESRCHFWDR